MHILTKVFVLFAAVLSIMLSALTISYTINTDQIVSNYNDALASAEVAAESLRAQTAQHELVSREKDSEIQGLRAQLQANTATMRDLEADRTRLQTDLRGVQADKAAADRRVQGALEATKAQALIIEAYKDEVTQLRNNELQAREQMLQLEERLSNEISRSQVLEANIRALQEQIANPPKTGAGQTDTGDLSEPQEIPGGVIRGLVQNVTFDSAMGQYVVQINLGQNDRVNRNNKLIITRGSAYIADVVVISSDLNVSTARVTLLQPGKVVQTGDTVVSRLQP
ncbi:MAG: hypothetical protein DYG94_06545 [Leptolyngbya sp. PLA3]|nr:MAG: hypothetical protein EDM82_05895 [Cyanobacteria bacterium CYA]MCE7968388.1 hypothetical protein [Leptolyngbya sp. PL-A3]